MKIKYFFIVGEIRIKDERKKALTELKSRLP